LRCCRGRLIEEQKAEKLEERLEELKEKMIEEEAKLENGNNGACFVVFKYKYMAQEVIRKPSEFLSGVLASNPQIRIRFNVDLWTVEKAPPASDIIWSKLGTRDISSNLKSIFLYLLLFIFCVLLVSPLTVTYFSLNYIAL